MRWRGSWLPLALAIGAALIITTGGYIRIHDAGESCPDWPLCFGELHPFSSAEEQADWWAEHPDEIDSRGADHRYTSFEIFTEWFHRLLVGTIAVPMLAAWIIALRQRATLGDGVHRLGLAAGILLIVQAAAGWLTVKLDNAPYSVGLHLALALSFTTVLLAMWLAWARREDDGLPTFARWSRSTAAATWQPAVWSSFIVLVLLFIGALLATGGHNGACETGFRGWPGCRGVAFSLDTDTGVLLQQTHRIFALAVGAGLVVAWQRLGATAGAAPDAQGAEHAARLLLIALVAWTLNLLVGGLYIVLADGDGFPQWLSLTHLVVGAAAFVAAVLPALIARLTLLETDLDPAHAADQPASTADETSRDAEPSPGRGEQSVATSTLQDSVLVGDVVGGDKVGGDRVSGDKIVTVNDSEAIARATVAALREYDTSLRGTTVGLDDVDHERPLAGDAEPSASSDATQG